MIGGSEVLMIVGVIALVLIFGSGIGKGRRGA